VGQHRPKQPKTTSPGAVFVGRMSVALTNDLVGVACQPSQMAMQSNPPNEIAEHFIGRIKTQVHFAGGRPAAGYLSCLAKTT